VAKLNDEINRADKLPDVSDKLTAAGMIVVAESPGFFADFIRKEHGKYGKLVKDIGYQPQ